MPVCNLLIRLDCLYIICNCFRNHGKPNWSWSLASTLNLAGSRSLESLVYRSNTECGMGFQDFKFKISRQISGFLALTKNLAKVHGISSQLPTSHILTIIATYSMYYVY